jgi:hypothetical protein
MEFSNAMSCAQAANPDLHAAAGFRRQFGSGWADQESEAACEDQLWLQAASWRPLLSLALSQTGVRQWS